MSLRLLATTAILLFAVPAVAGEPNLAGGGWAGSWESDATGHRGPLKARFAPAGGDAYRVTFRGRFRTVIPFRYTVRLNVVGSDGEHVYLAGEQRVPLFGTFHYSATATPTSFDAEFRSRKDSGRFVLRR